MGVIDIVIVCCFLPALYFGIKLSLNFSIPAGNWVVEHLHLTEFWAKAVSFILIFFAIAIVLNLFGKLVEKIIKISLLGWLNKLLGTVMTLFLFVLLLSALVYLVDSANNILEFIPKEKLEESRFYPQLLHLSQEIFPRFKELFHQPEV